MDAPTLKVVARFKNARLYNLIAESANSSRGFIRGFCRLHGISYPTTIGLLSLRINPVTTTGVRPICTQLATLLGVSVEYLFPTELYQFTWPEQIEHDIDGERFLQLHAAGQARLMLPPSAEEAVHDRELREAVQVALSTLTPRERRVISMRYGLKNDVDYTLKQTGAVFSVGAARARQIEARAMRKLRHPMRAEKLKPFLD